MGFLDRTAAVLIRFRHLVAVGWLAAAIAAVTLLPSVEESQSGALGDLVPADARALEAELRSAELFAFPLQSRTVLVQRDPDGLTAAAQGRVAQRALRLSRGEIPRFRNVPGALPVLNTVSLSPFTREGGTTALTFLFFEPGIGTAGRTGLAELLGKREAGRPDDAFVGVTGAVPARRAQGREIARALPLVELGTVLLVALTVGLHFRGVLAPVITLLAVGAAYLVSIHLTAGIGQAVGVSVPREIEPVVIVLLFGIVTDYAVFYISRMRRRLAAGTPPREAVRRATIELLPTIVTAGLTIALATSALVVADVGFLQAFGPGLSLGVLVGLLVATTLLPALLAIGGRWVFWPSRAGRDLRADEAPAPEAPVRRTRNFGLRLAVRHPLAMTIATLVLLGSAATGVTRLEVGQTVIRGLPADAEPLVAYNAASAGFAPGVMAPTALIIEQRGIARERAALRRLQTALAGQPGVAAVFGPAQQPLSEALGAVFAASGDAARFAVVFEDDPLGAGAIRSLERLDRRLPDLLADVGLPDARPAVVGDTALAAETVSAVGGDLARIAPLTIAVVLLTLVLFLRSLVAPLYLVLSSAIALCAALGLTVYVFQDWLGHGELTFYVPFCAAVLLLALGSDYNVFLAGRIWDRARELPFRRAVMEGASGAATAITVAGLVLALSFGLLALVDLRPFRELAFVMGVGLLIDAFIVRTLLAPALITLVGPIGMWPRRPNGSGSHAGTPASRMAESRQ